MNAASVEETTAADTEDIPANVDADASAVADTDETAAADVDRTDRQTLTDRHTECSMSYEEGEIGWLSRPLANIIICTITQFNNFDTFLVLLFYIDININKLTVRFVWFSCSRKSAPRSLIMLSELFVNVKK